jgi:hypothetical protein
MGLFGKKKEEKIPELPKAPSLGSLGGIPPRTGLPTIPGKAGGVNQAMVKSAVEDRESSGIPSMSSPHNFGSLPEVNSDEHSEVPSNVFVRIDKVKDAKDELDKSMEVLAKMESYVEDLKEEQAEEMKEVQDLEKDISEMKLILSKVDKDIFNKL